MKEEIFIEGNVPSSKNNKELVYRKVKNASDKVMFIKSKRVQHYEKTVAADFLINKPLFKKMIAGKPLPYRISFRFVRDSRQKFDYINPLQTIQDLMQKHGWIEDDCADILLPVIEPYEYNKFVPGVYIKVL